jgi:hypothetical protein
VTQNSVGYCEVLVISTPGRKGSGMPFQLASFWERTSGMAFRCVPSEECPWLCVSCSAPLQCISYLLSLQNRISFSLAVWLKKKTSVRHVLPNKTNSSTALVNTAGKKRLPGSVVLSTAMKLTVYFEIPLLMTYDDTFHCNQYSLCKQRIQFTYVCIYLLQMGPSPVAELHRH